MSSKKKILILLALVVLCEIIFFILIKSIESTSPGFEIYDMKLFYSITTFKDNLALLNVESYPALISFKILDTAFPFIYGLLLFNWLKYIKVSNKYLLAIPLIGMSSDLLENTILTLKTFFTDNVDYLLYLSNIFTIIKFTSIIVSVILIIYFRGKGSKKNDDFRNGSSNN